MRFTHTLPVALAFVAVAAACGGDSADQTEAPATETAPQMTAAPVSSPCFLNGASMEEARARPSPLQEVDFSVGGHPGTLCYGAPSANERQVMGALVPFGEPWRLGANEATALHLTGPAQVGGVDLQAGSYSLYAVPGESEWTFHLSTLVERWGIPIGDDVLAAEVGSFTSPVEATDGMVETLTFTFLPWEGGTMGDLVMEWENTRVKFHLHPVG